MALQYQNKKEYRQIGTFHRGDTGATDKANGLVLQQIAKRLGGSGREGYFSVGLGKGQDIGGSFNLKKNLLVSDPVYCGKIYHTSSSLDYSYNGFLVPYGTNWEKSMFGLNSYLPDNYAAEAYNRMKPAKPEFSAALALAELRDLPRSLRHHFFEIPSGSFLKHAGGSYLSAEFGWKPLLRDVLSLVQLQRKLQKRLKQLLRDNGRPVRRRFNLFETTTELGKSTYYGTNAFSPVFVSQFYADTPRKEYTSKLVDRVWASAQFRYWLPPGPRDVKWTRKMLTSLYGVDVTPSQVYNAIPWTWLIDWFSNLGDVIENMDYGVASNLASDYFYTMREYTFERKMEATGWFHTDPHEQNVRKVSGSNLFTQNSKCRVKGNPFGFAVDESTLSAGQIAILGALGLSRLS